MRLPEHIVKNDTGDSIELICKRCKGSMKLWTDNREFKEKQIKIFVKYHKNCKKCEDGVCSIEYA